MLSISQRGQSSGSGSRGKTSRGCGINPIIPHGGEKGVQVDDGTAAYVDDGAARPHCGKRPRFRESARLVR